ncbi:squamosa promoter-binding-like protein 15 [Aristolochia californica]|uniref:squamosa promoter-binding-like protein 15 n=1 Tax=Aristolochia californica TaxID=171875 RepID=UPI0035E04C30
MEGEVGAQVAPPIFIHQALPGRFCEAPTMTRKRDLPWQSHNFQQQQNFNLQHQASLRLNSAYQNPKSNWNPKVWDWDSVMFVAKPSMDAEELRLGTADSVEIEQKKKAEEVLKPLALKKGKMDDSENLTLKLGATAYSPDEPVVRPSKRVRSGSPGGGTYPMCQVDDCKGDLSNAKDYHRRHKVCELHSKTTKALVGQQMQRFCQQCSRFHPLSEFDEGKRSCRRRLAGHNRRRRKTQPDDVSSRLLLTGNRENNGGGNVDIVNLLTILARLQGNNLDKTANVPSITDRDRLIQILSKINSLPVSAESTARSSVTEKFDLNLSHSVQASSEHPVKANENTTPPSTADLLAVFSAALSASSPDVLAILSQGGKEIGAEDRRKQNGLDKDNGFIAQKKLSAGFAPIGVDRVNTLFQTPAMSSESPVQETHSALPLQLFSSSPEDDSPKLATARKYFSSESSSPADERSPSSSPPIVQKLFPLHSAKHERMSISREDSKVVNMVVEASTDRGWAPPLGLFKSVNRRADNSTASNPPYQAGYTSSSGSDHSPSSSNSDSQDRTGRIIFKLFDKDPSNFPGTLRTEILNWLSHSPSEMESYIRPGCVVLSVYVSLPTIAWEEFQEDLLQRVSSLIKDSDSDFWKSGRFLVQTDRHLASHKDGKIRLCKSWRNWSSPELLSVSPVAVVAGQATSLVLRGRNLTAPGTKIHCTFMGGYTSKEVSGAAYAGTIYDDSSIESFDFPGGIPNDFGRCFIEVENGFKGNSFPVIVADALICQELRTLEAEFEHGARMEDITLEDQVQFFGQPRSKEDVLHFLNELGWLFQKRCTSKSLTVKDFSLIRFKYLFTFSVERDWSALVKMLLDILVEGNPELDRLSKDLLEILSEIHLLNRAVKRKCRKMVDLLVHYYVSCSSDASKKYLFLPNLAGPGGVTPLHLAACTQGSEEIVDELTNDPQEIGLNCWTSLLDVSGQSPYMYASARSHHSYNRLVARKLADRRNGQVSISVVDADTSLDQSWIVPEPDKPTPQPSQVRSCTQCAISMTRRSTRIPGAQGLLHRPYVHSMLAIAAVCVCVCLLFRGLPQIGSIDPFKWENVGYGSF